jgi:hypothetical protein
MAHITPQEDLLEYTDKNEGSQITHGTTDKNAGIADHDRPSEPNPPSPPVSPRKDDSGAEQIDGLDIDPPLYTAVTQTYRISLLFPSRQEDRGHPASHREGINLNTIGPHAIKDSSHVHAYSDMAGQQLRTAPLVAVLDKQDPRELFRLAMAENRMHYPFAGRPRRATKTIGPVRHSPREEFSLQAQLGDTPTIPLTKPTSTNSTTPYHVVKPAPRKVTRPENKKTATNKNTQEHDFEAIEDFCPSTRNLGDGDDAFGPIKWRSSLLNHDNDPYRDLLHPAELKAAAILRLDCAHWLEQKRKIFRALRECQNQGIPFNKTKAQQAASIDVNKVSQLFTIFERVGWFDDDDNMDPM